MGTQACLAGLLPLGHLPHVGSLQPGVLLSLAEYSMFFCTLICAESIAIFGMVQEYRESYNTYLVEDLFFRMGLASIMLLDD